MSREEIIAWIGLVLAVPAFALFASQNVIAGGLAILVIVVAATALWLLKRPEFTILDVEKVLTFHDPQGRQATLEQRQTVRANHRGLIEYCFRGISADGSIPMTIAIDNLPPDSNREIAGQRSVCKRFAEPLQWRQKIIIILRIDVTDAFGGKREGLIHEVPFATQHLRMRVKFNRARPARQPSLTLRYVGNVHRTLPTPVVSSDGLEIETDLKRLKPGGQYQLE